jgi:hypothetical protein
MWTPAFITEARAQASPGAAERSETHLPPPLDHRFHDPTPRNPIPQLTTGSTPARASEVPTTGMSKSVSLIPRKPGLAPNVPLRRFSKNAPEIGEYSHSSLVLRTQPKLHSTAVQTSPSLAENSIGPSRPRSTPLATRPPPLSLPQRPCGRPHTAHMVSCPTQASESSTSSSPEASPAQPTTSQELVCFPAKQPGTSQRHRFASLFDAYNALRRHAVQRKTRLRASELPEKSARSTTSVATKVTSPSEPQEQACSPQDSGTKGLGRQVQTGPFAQSPRPEESTESSRGLPDCNSSNKQTCGNRRSCIILTNTSIDCLDVAAGLDPPLLSAKNLVPESGNAASEPSPFLGGPRTEFAMQAAPSPAPLPCWRLVFNSLGSSNPWGPENLSSTWDLTHCSTPIQPILDTYSSVDDDSSRLNTWRSAPAILADSEQYHYELFRLEGVPAAATPDTATTDPTTPTSLRYSEPILPPQSAPQLRGAPEVPLYAARFVAHPANACLQRSGRDTPLRKQLPGSLSLPNPSVFHHATDLADTAFLDDSPVQLGMDAEILGSLSATAAVSSSQAAVLRLSPSYQKESRKLEPLTELPYAADLKPPITLEDGIAEPSQGSEGTGSVQDAGLKDEALALAAADHLPTGLMALQTAALQEVTHAPARRWPANVPRVTLSMLLPSESSMFSNPFTHRSQAESTPRTVYSTLPPRRHIFIHSDLSDPCLPLLPCCHPHGAFPLKLAALTSDDALEASPSYLPEPSKRPIDGMPLASGSHIAFTPPSPQHMLQSVQVQADWGSTATSTHLPGKARAADSTDARTQKELPLLQECQCAIDTNPVCAILTCSSLAPECEAAEQSRSTSTTDANRLVAQEGTGPAFKAEVTAVQQSGSKSSSNVGQTTGPLAEDTSLTELVRLPQTLSLCSPAFHVCSCTFLDMCDNLRGL